MRAGRHRRPEGNAPEPTSQTLDEEHKTKSKLSVSPIVAGILVVGLLTAMSLSVSTKSTEPAGVAVVTSIEASTSTIPTSVPEATPSLREPPLLLPPSVTTTMGTAPVHANAGHTASNPRSERVARPVVTLPQTRPHAVPFPRPIFDNQTCPSTTVLDGNCIHANSKLKCAPLRRDDRSTCKRPCGALAIKLRGAGGVLLREGLLMSVYGGAGFGKGLDESFIVSEGWAYQAPRNVEKVQKFKPRNAVFLTALRHPVNRILSRYWYEGRFQMGTRAVGQKPLELRDWINQVNNLETTTRGRPMRLWSCVSNYYVKTFAGWLGDPLCGASAESSRTTPSSAVTTTTATADSRTSNALVDGFSHSPESAESKDEEGCVGGVGRAQLAKAKEVLEKKFHAVLITEWLDHEAQIEWLGQLFCFPTRPRVTRKHRKLGEVPYPLLAPKAAPGGHSSEKPLKWRASDKDMQRLEELNALDLELFEWAKERARNILSALNASASPPFLPLPEPTSHLKEATSSRNKKLT